MSLNEMDLRDFGKFVGFNTRGDCEGGGSYIVCMPRIETWLATVTRCLTKREMFRGQKLKLCADAQRTVVEEAMEQLTWNMSVLVQ